MHGLTRVIVFGAVIAMAGCGTPPDQEPEALDRTTEAEADSPTLESGPDAGDRPHSGAEPAHAHGGSGDPAPLLQIMQGLGTEMTSLTYGLMTEDGEQVATSAHAMADHAPISQDDLDRIHQELGAEMAEFERLDEAVHEGSIRLHEAAESGDTDEVLSRLNELQRNCMACHERFRERLRTNPAP